MSSAIGAYRAAIGSLQGRAKTVSQNVQSQCWQNAPLCTSVTQKAAPGDGVLDEQQPAGMADAHGHY